MAKRSLHELRGCEAGASAVEFAIISLVMIVVSLATIEFGRGLHVRNEVSFAADFAARKILLEPAISDSALEAAVRERFDQQQGLLQVVLGSETADGIQFRTVAMSYPLQLLIPGLTNSDISVNLMRRIPVLGLAGA